MAEYFLSKEKAEVRLQRGHVADPLSPLTQN
jgi:hypothetical protein